MPHSLRNIIIESDGEVCMEKILVMDEHNYEDHLGEMVRISVRGIILIDGKLLMIENSLGEVKLPGGGMEFGEDDYRVLIREVKYNRRGVGKKRENVGKRRAAGMEPTRI